jgi:hypothetical protein
MRHCVVSMYSRLKCRRLYGKEVIVIRMCIERSKCRRPDNERTFDKDVYID